MTSKFKTVGTLAVTFIFAAAALGGWVLNIIKLVNLDDSHSAWEISLRVIGVFVGPLGVVLGFL